MQLVKCITRSVLDGHTSSANITNGVKGLHGSNYDSLSMMYASQSVDL